MALTSGARLGPYEIISALGAGGMGQVYRARDTRLDRVVAIKILPPHLSGDPALRQRFEREAKAISSLNHPHICVLYDVGNQDGTEFLVMECVEGETLAKRLEKGPLPLEQALKYGTEIADALDKAHRNGVVHRDLKPGNIMLTASGAKLLDFGLAKVAPPLGAGATLTAAATRTTPLTQQGTLVGTFQYMSPEQLEGKDVDARSDIFSFGSVLYEMVSGRRAFPGKSQISVASAILEKEPEPISTLQPLTPPALDRAIRVCLAQDPQDRWQTARDLLLELKWIAEAGSEAGVPAPIVSRRKVREKILWGVAAVSLVLAAAISYAYIRRMSVPVRPIRSLILPPEKVSFALTGGEGGPVLSPDGTRLVFTARDASGKEALWVRSLDSLTAQRLEGTEDSSFAFWSPDSRTIGFFAGGKLKKIDAGGGPAQTLCDAPGGRGGAWSEREVIVFAPEITSGLSRVPVAGGTPTEITHLAQSQAGFSHRWPTFLPDGRHFLYWGGNPFITNAPNTGIFLGALDSNEENFLVQADSSALYAPPGYLLYVREQTLMAQPFDAGSLKLKGDAFPVGEHVSSPQLFRLGLFTVSQSGLLVYQTGQGVSAQFLWLDVHGNKVGTVGEAGNQLFPRLSPNGARLAYVRVDPQSKNADIWLMDLARGVPTRFTFDPAPDNWPVWSPDGSRIVFASARKGHTDLYVKDASGAANEESLYESNGDKTPKDWSRDGRYIVFDVPDPTRRPSMTSGCCQCLVIRNRFLSSKLRSTNSGGRFRPMVIGSPTSPTRPGSSKFTSLRFLAQVANGRSRKAAAFSRCGSATAVACSTWRREES